MSDPSERDTTGRADVAWSRTALARLALSEAAAVLADSAVSLVPTINDGWARPSDNVEHAAQLVAAAREVLDRAVVYDRERGASWSAIGEALDVTRQSAHERYAPVVARWESGLDEPWSDDGRNPGLPTGASDPDQSPARLDRWCATHITDQTSGARQQAERAGAADRMVSAELPQHTATSEAASVTRQIARHLTERGATPEPRQPFGARKRALLGDDPAAAVWKPVGCSCHVTDPAGPREYRVPDPQCPVHRPGSVR